MEEQKIKHELLGIYDNKDIAKRTIKDSVFTSLLLYPPYPLQAYQRIHPEDKTADINEIHHVTISNTLTNNLYNDPGFVVGDRLLILIEAQSTWTSNILIRFGEYFFHTIRSYCRQTEQNISQISILKFPEPEFYLIYTGKNKGHIDKLQFSKDFFGGKKTRIEIEAEVIHAQPEKHDILTQYIQFAWVYDGQRKIYKENGRKRISETIRICKERNILREYLTNHESGVFAIMFDLFTQEGGGVDNYGSYREQQGLIRGRAEGRPEGKAEGLVEGRAVGLAEGKAESREESIKLLVSKYKKFGFSEDAASVEIANDFHLTNAEASEKTRAYWK